MNDHVLSQREYHHNGRCTHTIGTSLNLPYLSHARTMPPFSAPTSPFPGSRLKVKAHTPWLVQPWLPSLLFLTYIFTSFHGSRESCPKVADAGPRRALRERPCSIAGWTSLTPSARPNVAYTLQAHARSFRHNLRGHCWLPRHIARVGSGPTPSIKRPHGLCGRWCSSSQPNA